MLYILCFLMFAAFAMLIISGLTEACADVLRWAETRYGTNQNAELKAFGDHRSTPQNMAF